MKTKSFLFSLLVVLLSFTGCFSNWTGDDGLGSFSITFGSGSGRTALPWGNEDIQIEDLDHTITLFNGPGPDQIREGVKFGQTVNFSVTPGFWDISVKAYDSDGLLWAVALVERVEIKAGKNGAIPIAMKEHIDGVTVTTFDDIVFVAHGDTLQFYAYVTPSTATQGVDWVVTGATSADTTIGIGGILAVAADEMATTLTVTATSKIDNTKSGSVTVTVVTATPTGVTVTAEGDATTVTLGETLRFNAVVNPLGAPQDVYWEVSGSTNTGTSIDQNGLLTVAATETAGTTLLVTAKSKMDNNKSDSVTVTVVHAAPTNVVVAAAGNAATVVRGSNTLQFTAVVDPPTASQSVNWSVSGSTLGGTTISADGTLTVDVTEAAGTSLTITATSTALNTVIGSVMVTVVNPTLTGTVTIVNENKYINGELTATVTFTGRALTENASPIFQWKSQNNPVGTNSDKYTLGDGDFNRTILVEVSAADFEGNIISGSFNTTVYGASNKAQWVAAVNKLNGNGSGSIIVLGDILDMTATDRSFTPANGKDYPFSIYGKTGNETLQLSESESGSLIRVASNQFVTISDLNLKGNATNDAALVYVEGGTLTMGSLDVIDPKTCTIAGNKNTTGNGGGVYVADGATFNLRYCTIYGDDEPNPALANTAPNGTGAALYGTAYGKGSSGEPLATLNNEENTIIVVNGQLTP